MSLRTGGLVGVRVRRVRQSVGRFLRAIHDPLPPLQVQLGAAVPAWLPRLLLLALGLAAILVLRPAAFTILLLAVFAVLMAVRPGGIAGPAWAGLVGLVWLVEPVATPLVFPLLAIAAAGPALGSAIGLVPLQTRVQLRALRPALVRYAVLQLIVQPVVALLLVLSRTGVSSLPVTIVAIALAAGAVWLLLPRLREDG